MRRFEWLAKKIRKHRYAKGAEIGLKAGKTTSFILDACPEVSIIGCDIWTPVEDEQIDEAGNVRRYSGPGWDQDAQTQSEHTCRQRLKKFGPRARIIKQPSVEAATLIDDDSLDFVFIDGLHSEEAVRADILSWWSKLRVGGMMAGHDIDWRSVHAAVINLLPQYAIAKSDNVWFVIKKGKDRRAFHNILVPELELAFILNGKCASTSVKHMILHQLGHYRTPDKCANIGLTYSDADAIPSDCRKIAIVRDPLERLVSTWRDKGQKARPQFELLGIPNCASFSEFAAAVCALPDNATDAHLISQTASLYSQGLALADMVIKLENIRAGWRKLRSDVSGLPELPHIRAADSPRPSRISSKTRDLVRQRYAADYDLLGYEVST